jgi:hypothetical protein
MGDESTAQRTGLSARGPKMIEPAHDRATNGLRERLVYRGSLRGQCTGKRATLRRGFPVSECVTNRGVGARFSRTNGQGR